MSQPKKRGRPATGKDPLVGFRMPPDIAAAIDAYIAAWGDPTPSKSDAIRAILREQLIQRGYLK